ncbi:hypothetical protein GNI_053930 [Gregarina niphandrodes]|uniref:Uncharacterized protein n=1 Tax=Gregarina niphandrodes TaxID=110365 RepID=A0A023B968_GRENI|nr:hypothetical protein GNI_053930 [Gregarina niphandrodes]EZG70944.1 hypothetical protein GNI_053930 [Gregarina niphandrodes]|eukprot:XP_011129859.1 hypothetical protein GNI_053930 [Gregarina niphandrodes]
MVRSARELEVCEPLTGQLAEHLRSSRAWRVFCAGVGPGNAWVERVDFLGCAGDPISFLLSGQNLLSYVPRLLRLAEQPELRAISVLYCHFLVAFAEAAHYVAQCTRELNLLLPVTAILSQQMWKPGGELYPVVPCGLTEFQLPPVRDQIASDQIGSDHDKTGHDYPGLDQVGSRTGSLDASSEAVWPEFLGGGSLVGELVAVETEDGCRRPGIIISQSGDAIQVVHRQAPLDGAAGVRDTPIVGLFLNKPTGAALESSKTAECKMPGTQSKLATVADKTTTAAVGPTATPVGTITTAMGTSDKVAAWLSRVRFNALPLVVPFRLVRFMFRAMQCRVRCLDVSLNLLTFFSLPFLQTLGGGELSQSDAMEMVEDAALMWKTELSAGARGEKGADPKERALMGLGVQSFPSMRLDVEEDAELFASVYTHHIERLDSGTCRPPIARVLEVKANVWETVSPREGALGLRKVFEKLGEGLDTVNVFARTNLPTAVRLALVLSQSDLVAHDRPTVVVYCASGDLADSVSSLLWDDVLEPFAAKPIQKEPLSVSQRWKAIDTSQLVFLGHQDALQQPPLAPQPLTTIRGGDKTQPLYLWATRLTYAGWLAIPFRAACLHILTLFRDQILAANALHASTHALLNQLPGFQDLPGPPAPWNSFLDTAKLLISRLGTGDPCLPHESQLRYYEHILAAAKLFIESPAIEATQHLRQLYLTKAKPDTAILPAADLLRPHHMVHLLQYKTRMRTLCFTCEGPTKTVSPFIQNMIDHQSSNQAYPPR